MHTPLKHVGLKLSPPEADHWIAGQGKAGIRFGGDLNPLGDWREYIPTLEPQSREGFDTLGCAVEHTLRAYITLARYLGFADFVPDASERYTGAWAGTGPQGTDPHDVAETIRATSGLIPQELMPWTDQKTFDSYYDKAIARLNLPTGRAYLERFTFGYEWIFPFGSSLTPAEKAAKLKEYLRRGTVCVSVSGQYAFRKGKLVKQDGVADSHWVQLVAEGEISDSYDPQFKKLERHYNHDAAMVYFLKRREPGLLTGFWASLLDNFTSYWARLKS